MASGAGSGGSGINVALAGAGAGATNTTGDDIYAFIINCQGTSRALSVTSATGSVDVYAVDNPSIVSSAGGLGGTTFTDLSSPPSAVFTPTLTYPNPTDADLSYTINFSPSGLTANQHSVGNAVNAIQTAGVAAFRPVAAELFFIPTVPLLGKTYDSLSGEGVSGIEQSIFSARAQYFNASMINASAAIGAGSGPFSLSTGGSAPLAASRWRFWMSGFGVSGYDAADAIVRPSALKATRFTAAV